MTKPAKPIYLYRNTGPTLKIADAGNGYWRLSVGEWGGDFFEDERDAVDAAVKKRSGFAEWDDISETCPSDLTKWERI
ncbi:hypothetical protein [Roseovarius sp. 2305UL8-3]|uniref:hypothetical protein n=1 Tax=Roseovarius conchicola TaxID=3121636 RepID=UPI0035296FB7